MFDEDDIKQNRSQSLGKTTKGSMEPEILSATLTISPP